MPLGLLSFFWLLSVIGIAALAVFLIVHAVKKKPKKLLAFGLAADIIIALVLTAVVGSNAPPRPEPVIAEEPSPSLSASSEVAPPSAPIEETSEASAVPTLPDETSAPVVSPASSVASSAEPSPPVSPPQTAEPAPTAPPALSPDPAQTTEPMPPPTVAPTPKIWYEGGTLHKASIPEWKAADYENKLATCADFIAAARDNLNLKITDVDSIKPYAEELVAFLDSAVEGDDAEQIYGGSKIPDLVLIGVLMMGWGS
jgi:hypothetical protein